MYATTGLHLLLYAAAMPMTMAERRQATREHLMDAALVLFADRGIMAASAVQIAAAAGYTRGAFHSHFASKDELALAVLRRESERYLHSLNSAGTSIIPGQGPTAAVVEQALSAFLAAMVDDRASLLMRLEARLYAARVPPFRAPLLEVDAELRGGVAEVMRTTLARLGLALTVDPSRAVNLIVMTYEQESLSALLEGRSLPSPAVRSAMLEVFGSIVCPVAD